MKILILEDDIIRIKKFNELFKYQEVYMCQDIYAAKDVCKTFKIDLMLLDHDLGNKIWVDSKEENTGYQFVKWLVDNNLQKQSLIYIHSMNFVGANRMLDYLKSNEYDGIWIPFHILKFKEE